MATGYGRYDTLQTEGCLIPAKRGGSYVRLWAGIADERVVEGVQVDLNPLYAVSRP